MDAANSAACEGPLLSRSTCPPAFTFSRMAVYSLPAASCCPGRPPFFRLELFERDAGQVLDLSAIRQHEAPRDHLHFRR
eukprot:9325824-Pyramimonas_sp.AAC.1